jgi:hypothetical protein
VGTALVEQAHMARARHKMTDRAFVVLLLMAHTARDPGSRSTTDPCLYFRGHPYLCRALVPDDPDSPGARRAVKRAVAELTRLGLVTLKRPGAPGRNAEYLLHLAPW